MPVKSVPTLGWTRRSAAISVLLVFEEQRKRAGERVVQLREAKSWTQEDLSARSGLSVKTVSRFENGRHEGRNETVRKLAKALRVNEIDITGPPPDPLGLSSEPEPPGIQEQLAAMTAAIDTQAAALQDQAGVLKELRDAVQELRDLIATQQTAAQELHEVAKQVARNPTPADASQPPVRAPKATAKTSSPRASS
jgi:transcriptional regulator with XRE-family HTH domain